MLVYVYGHDVPPPPLTLFFFLIKLLLMSYHTHAMASTDQGDSLSGSARDAKKLSRYFLPERNLAICHHNDSSQKRRRKQLQFFLVICFVATLHLQQVAFVEPPQPSSYWVSKYRRLIFDEIDISGDISTYANGKRVSPSRISLEVEPYTAASMLRTNQQFRHALMLIVFDSPTGTLQTYANENFGFNKFRGHLPSYILSRALMQNFPERFQVGQDPFQILFTSADLPPGSWWQQCLIKKLGKRHCSNRVKHFAPILTFGSAPKDASALPSLHQFPLTTFLSCLERDKCGMTTPTEIAPQWNGLKPQIVWRGSDFPM